MRSVLLIRHAKSSWNDALMSDFDRPLNERGKKDAPDMAKHLLEKSVPIDSFISSPAKRARKTALSFMKAYGVNENDIILNSALYLPVEQYFFDVIEALPDSVSNIAIFSHNPGITNFVNLLTSEIRVDDVPTCGVFGIKTGIAHWKDFKKADKKFWFFDYPRNHV